MGLIANVAPDARRKTTIALRVGPAVAGSLLSMPAAASARPSGDSMSKLLLSHYCNDLARLKQVGGTYRESVVREAFKDLLKGFARSLGLVFISQYL